MITLKGNPISTNHIRQNVGSRRFITPQARALKEDYQWQAKSQWKEKPLKGNLAVNIILYFGDKRKRDWDNYHKLSCDALSGIVWEDDNQIKEAHVFVDYDKKNPRIEIEVS